MVLGVPRALLYWKYSVFIESFFEECGIEIIVSPDTNKDILDAGVKYCVDEACLPVKVFHGHVEWLKDKSDAIFVPRIMQLHKREYICPKFCGLPEMVKNSIRDLPPITMEPIYAVTEKELFLSSKKIAESFVKSKKVIRRAFDIALEKQKKFKPGYNDEKYNMKVGLLGHPYNIYDKFCNMDIVSKLHESGVGVITEEYVDEIMKNKSSESLFKKPFWTFARNSYGAASVLTDSNEVDGLIYISSFACGIDSVVIELIKERIGDFPFMILKVDEHSGEAGLETRVEAFVDMIERRMNNESKLSKSGEFISCG